MMEDTTEEIGEEVGLLILESKLNILNVYSINLNYFSIVISDMKNSPLTKVSVSKTRQQDVFDPHKNCNHGPLKTWFRALNNCTIKHTIDQNLIERLNYCNIFRKIVVFVDFLSGKLLFARAYCIFEIGSSRAFRKV